MSGVDDNPTVLHKCLNPQDAATATLQQITELIHKQEFLAQQILQMETNSPAKPELESARHQYHHLQQTLQQLKAKFTQLTDQVTSETLELHSLQ